MYSRIPSMCFSIPEVRFCCLKIQHRNVKLHNTDHNLINSRKFEFMFVHVAVSMATWRTRRCSCLLIFTEGAHC